MLNGYKFRLSPNQDQQQILLQWIGSQRLIYNAKVQEDRYYRRFQRKMVSTAGMEVPVDQEYSRFITERTAFLRQVPSQILRNRAVKFRQGYSRFFQKLGGRPKLKTKNGRQAVWLTSELFTFIPPVDEATGPGAPALTRSGVLRSCLHKILDTPLQVCRKTNEGTGSRDLGPLCWRIFHMLPLRGTPSWASQISRGMAISITYTSVKTSNDKVLPLTYYAVLNMQRFAME